MRAVMYEQIGTARDVLKFVDLAEPQAGPGEVRVKLVTSGINPSDVKMRNGRRGASLPFAQIIPHSDGAGVIDQVGDGVPASRIGERVWTWNAAWGRAYGTAADYVALPSAQAVRLPQGTDFAAAACMGIPAQTAYHACALGDGVRGRSVLIAGGAGAVGHYAIQFAKRLGARQVITTVSGPDKAALARAAGADALINYREEDVEARVRELTGGQGVDRIIEINFRSNVALDFAVARPEGEIIVVGTSQPEVPVPVPVGILKNLGVRFFMVYHLNAQDRARAVAGITDALESGTLQHNVAARFALERIVDAHELVEAGTATGNVILEL